MTSTRNENNDYQETILASAAADDDYAETEDEEVKLTCLGGIRSSYHDSDMETASEDENDSDDDEDDSDDEETKRDGVVQFVSERIGMTQSPVVRPQANSPARTPEALFCAANDALATSDIDTLVVLDDVDGQQYDEGNDDGVHLSADVPGFSPLATDDYSAVGDDDELGDDSSNDVLVGIFDYFDGNPTPSHQSDTFDEMTWLDHRIGVTEDNECFLTKPPKAKRVLSYSTLTMLNADAGHNDDALKRTKCDEPEQRSLDLPDFSLGAPAILQTETEWTILRSNTPYRERRNSCVSSDEEELDRRLEQELDECYGQSRDNTPIPLLTPPASPLMADDHIVVCEWPSNLTIDNAMTAILTDIRPLSPQSLDDPASDDDTNNLKVAHGGKSSALTPLLRGISVGLI
ncbi:hypothetical protein MPSEU_000346200 [Mayamaea pseudoterrestris]|nr:hypothetical protein MPSEU_000346200 [Mayamaea pseudoterrestris]